MTFFLYEPLIKPTKITCPECHKFIERAADCDKPMWALLVDQFIIQHYECMQEVTRRAREARNPDVDTNAPYE